MGPRPRRLTSGLLLAGVLGLGACAPVPTGTPSPVGTPSEPSPTSEESPPASSAPAHPLPDGDLPGTPFDAGPADGDEVAVVGVAADDVLNLRVGPGVEFDVVGELEPLGSAAGTGRARTLEEDGIWVELTSDGATGWANLRYLAYLGEVTDITSRLSVLPSGDDLAELGERVTHAWVSEGTEATPEITVVDGPHEGDLGEVTVDALGLEDDSVLGMRLHVFAQPDGDGFRVRTVEQTVLCARGVDAERLCV